MHCYWRNALELEVRALGRIPSVDRFSSVDMSAISRNRVRLGMADFYRLNFRTRRSAPGLKTAIQPSQPWMTKSGP